MNLQDQEMKIVIVGHVDHGKSTIIGRLMADTDSLPQGKLEQVRETCRRNSKPFEYAFLLDALKEEQAQGITIDVARMFFKTKQRNYIILDAPGHVEFLKNMVTGAAQAEAALLVIDAKEGIQINSLRHGNLLSMLGVKQVAILINKMDLVDYEEEIFKQIVDSYRIFLEKIGIEPIYYIPVSGRFGDNIASSSGNMCWYSGPTVLEALDQLKPKKQPIHAALRMPVQDVYKFTGHGDQRRIIAGTIESGILRVGDELIFYPSGREGRVHSIEHFPTTELTEVQAGYATGFTLEEQAYVSRGELVTKKGETSPKVVLSFRANLFWLGKNPMIPGKTYFLKLGTAKRRIKLEGIIRVMDASTLDPNYHPERIEINNAAECILKCDKPIAIDSNYEMSLNSRFVIVDEYEIAGGGIIQEAINERQLYWQKSTVSREDRESLNGHRSGVLWFTGLSGAGKSTLANALEKRLFAEGIRTYILDGDNVRQGLNQDLEFSPEDRAENIRRIAEVAKLFTDAGVLVLTAFISPYHVDRKLAKNIIHGDDFIEIYVRCSIEECEKRDAKGLYAKARRGEISQFTGVSAPYEVPENPDIVVSTEEMNIEQCVEEIMTELKNRKVV
ncbi:adenylyl-sulfate kinase [Desulfitobacterium metallireducens]|uniref:Adenylyl-sulfate kinase n=1 Tax=Desulfitobacterium metallireducens DSM 15288 TaxID=871968 RepID=W0EBC9_9FIRM|nr:adenylyl-sulfate kinase [Desulfitobacterium metallireducens]AHF08072.1 adenylylsulfate kinase [Desulfitobacterium metallireducens DSM 15288]